MKVPQAALEAGSAPQSVHMPVQLSRQWGALSASSAAWGTFIRIGGTS